MIQKINYADKQTGGKFSASDANVIKSTVNLNADVLSENSQSILSLQGGQLGSIKPTDAAPTPARNGNYTFSIGGNKPAWLTAEAGITTVKAGDGVSVVYTAPSTYSYTHVNVMQDEINKRKQLAAIFSQNNIFESAKIPNTTIGNNTGILETSATHFAIFGIATKTIVLNSSAHNQIHFYDKDFNYLGYSPAYAGTTINNTLNAAYYGIAISNTGTLKIVSNDEYLQSQITDVQYALTVSSEGIEQTKEYPNYWLNSGETGFPENIIEADANRVVTVISTPKDAPFDINVLPTIRKFNYTLPSGDKKIAVNIMQDAPKITFMFWTKASQLTAAGCTTISVLGKIGGVQNWRNITLPTSVGQEQKNNEDEEMRLKMIEKYGDWVCFRFQWDNTVHNNYFMFRFNVSLAGELYFANVFLSKSIINIDALTVRYKLRNSTLPVLMAQSYQLLNSSKNFLFGNEFYSLCDSLGTDGTWQNKLATLAGATFSNAKNNDVTKPLSIGGTGTIGNEKNCGQWRARNLVSNYPTAKILFIENINDMNFNNGTINDLPFMLTRIDNYPDQGLTSLAAANSYWTTNFAAIVSSYTPIKGACLNIPYYGSGKNLKITGLPSSNGNVSIIVNGITYSIAVTTSDTMQTLIAKILEYQYGLVTDSANADGISVDFYYWSGLTVTFNASSTGMTVAIADTTTAQIFTPRYFMGEANTTDWNNAAKWSSNLPTTYAAMRGLIEYLQTNLPTCELIWVIPTRYAITLSNYLRADGTPDIDAFNAADTTYQSLCIKQKAICDLYNIRYVDLNKKSGITLYNLLSYYNENNVHPKTAGYEKWGEMIYKILIG